MKTGKKEENIKTYVIYDDRSQNQHFDKISDWTPKLKENYVSKTLEGSKATKDEVPLPSFQD